MKPTTNMEVDPEHLKTLYVGNLGAHLVKKNIQDLLHISDNELATGVSLELKTLNECNYALFTAPERRIADLLPLNNTEFMGRKLCVELSADGLPPPSKSLPRGSGVGSGGTFAEAAASSHNTTPQAVRQYVEIDCTPFFDCYKIPRTSTLVYAVSQQFKDDRSKRLFPRRQGIWILETEDISQYLNSDQLLLNGECLAKLSVKAQKTGKQIDENGKVVYERNGGDDRENDILITLYEADLDRYRGITRDEIYQKIAEIGFGTLKKGITQQFHKDSDLPNGNLYFVLTDIDKERDVKRLPHAFEFFRPGGSLRMWLNFRGKQRKCFFCSEVHEVSHCPVKERWRALEEKRNAKLAEGNGKFGVKTYGDSTLRHLNQNALACNVDAMSGGTTGNVLNAVEIDEESKEVKNIIIVSGTNELNPRHSKEEFLWLLKKNTERLVSLGENKNVGILAPPPQDFLDTECQVRELFFHDHLRGISHLAETVHVWKNPLPAYSNDNGRHPSPEESIQLIKYLSGKAKETFGEDLILENALDDMLTAKNFYKGVSSLYKYGCGACSSRTKNKWPLLCDGCVGSINNTADEELKTAVAEYDAAVEMQKNVMNPPLSVEVPIVTDATIENRDFVITPYPSSHAGDLPSASGNDGRERSPIKSDDNREQLSVADDEKKKLKKKKSVATNDGVNKKKKSGTSH